MLDPPLNLDERSEYLDGLEKFISQSWESLKFVTKNLGWDLEQFEEEERETVTCPLNPEHRMPAETLEAHLERCRRRREGYAEDDPELPEPSLGVSSPSCVLIDEELQQKILTDPSTYPAAYIVVARVYLVGILPMRGGGSRRPVPRTADRARADFTPAERLAVYNYAVANTQSPAVVKAEELNLTYKKNEESRPKSKLELLMEMRDAKRRRISYRSKKVHTSRKSHLEILREVIGNQMEFLEEMNKPEGEEEEEEQREPPVQDVDQTSNGERTVDGKGEDPDEALWEDGNRKTGKWGDPQQLKPRSSGSNVRRDGEHKRWRHEVPYKERPRSSDSREHGDRYHRGSESRERGDRYHRGSESQEREDRYHRRPESQERGDGYHRTSRSHHRHHDVEPYGSSKKRRRRSSESLRSEERENDFGSWERDDRYHRWSRSHHHRHRDVDSSSRQTEAEPYGSSKKRRRRSENPGSEERENDFGKVKKSSKSHKHKKKKKRKKHRSRSSSEEDS